MSTTMLRQPRARPELGVAASEGGACQVHDLGGVLVSRAFFCSIDGSDDGALELRDFDQPGRIVSRCLLGGVREVWLQRHGQVAVRVWIERTWFDLRRGRLCIVRIRSAGDAANAESP